MVELRDFQEETIRETVKTIKEYKKLAPLVVSPTGSGKTILFSFLSKNAKSKGKNVLILVHRKEILEQTVSKLFSMGVQAGIIASKHPQTNDLIQVAMVRTLINRLGSIPKPDLIIIDEAHHAVAGSWKKIQAFYPDVLRIGFTATPERLDGSGLIECFDSMVEGPTIKELVDDGWLSYPRMFVGPDVSKKEKIKITRGDYDKSEQTKKRKSRVYVGNVIEHYKKYLNGLPTVCFCVSIEHCHFMEEEFRAAGFRSATVHGEMNKTDREAAIEGLGTGEVQILCSCDVISEGVDIPIICGAILLRRTKSLAVYLQQVGRVLRPIWPDGFNPNTATAEERKQAMAETMKPFAIILDHAGNLYEHGRILANRNWSLVAKKRSQRKKEEVKADYTVCPNCGAVWKGKVRRCPDCDYDIEAAYMRAEGKKMPQEIAGILEEVLDDSTEKTEIEALIAQTIRIQNMSPADRQKAMLSNLYKYKGDKKVQGMATALGYDKNWTQTVWKRLKGRSY